MSDLSPRKLAIACMVITAAMVSPGTVEAGRRAKGSVPFESLPTWVRQAVDRKVDADNKNAVWLHEEMIIEPQAGGGIRITRRLAGKALRSTGLDIIGSQAIFYGGEDEIVSQMAWTILPDRTVLAARPAKDTFDFPAISGFSVFDDHRGREIDSPGVTVGSIVAVESVVLQSFDGGAMGHYFGDQNRSTAFTRFTLNVPEGWNMEAIPLRMDRLDAEVLETRASISYTAHDQRPVDREKFGPPYRSILPLLWYRWWSPDGSRGFRDWDVVATWYEELTAGILDDADGVSTIVDGMKPESPELVLDSLTEAFSFAARQVRYVSIQIGIGGYKPFSPAEVCQLRYGDCKAKTFLMLAMAGNLGLDSFPVLVRTSDRGPLNKGIPGPVQFNHVIAAVRLPDKVGEDLWSAIDVEGIGRIVFLDSTDSSGSPWALPQGIQGTTALLLTAENGILIELPVQPPGSAKTTRILEAGIDEQGTILEATLVESWTGTRASGMRGYYGGMSEEEHHQAVLHDLGDRFPGSEIVEYSIEGLKQQDDPIQESTKLLGGRLGKRISDLLIVEPGKLSYGLLTRNLPPPPRESPVLAGLPREERIASSIRVPQGWSPEELPAPLMLETPELEVSAQWLFADGSLKYERTARLLMHRIPPERYSEFRTALSRLQAEDNRAVVFVRE